MKSKTNNQSIFSGKKISWNRVTQKQSEGFEEKFLKYQLIVKIFN